jgi:integrase
MSSPKLRLVTNAAAADAAAAPANDLAPQPASQPDAKPKPGLKALPKPTKPKRKRGKRKAEGERTERGESKTPGVIVIPPRTGRLYYSLRFVEPETGRTREPKLEGVTTEAAANASALTLYRNLQKRELQVTLAGGREHSSSVASLRQEIETYLTSVKCKVSRRGKPTSPITLRRYRDQLEQFATWCEGRDCNQLNQLARTTLSEWKASRFVESTWCGKARKVSTVNQELKPVRQMLVASALAGRLVHLGSDAVRGALARVTQPAPTPVCYSVPALRAALRTALDFDISHHRPGRSAAMAPVVAVGLLAGMRRDEMAQLQVSEVIFDAPSEYDPSITTGVDVLRLPAEKVKTGIARDVLMAPYSPLLGELMRELIQGRPGREYVFRVSYQQMGDRMKRMRKLPKAPKAFCLKNLRSTCATYQSPLPGNAKAKADRLGHTLAVAEQHYLALPSGTPLSSPDLDTVMQCGEELREIIARVRADRAARSKQATKPSPSRRSQMAKAAAAAKAKKAAKAAAAAANSAAGEPSDTVRERAAAAAPKKKATRNTKPVTK